jgi:alkanesulfonate monooxygenase SsuD/methylene tetrahydromethanopterin reductase-like flavin-dependent oxidoreductase (luciferase family)
VFTAAATLEEAQTFYRAQKQQVKEAGRNPDHVLILPGVMPIVGARGKKRMKPGAN